MKEKIKKHKKLFGIFGIFLSIAVIGTIAYFSLSDEIENVFTSGTYSNETQEVFTSPEDWLPGDTTIKTLTVKNTGTICQKVRISLGEEWKDSNNTTLPNVQNGIKTVLLNLTNTNVWKKVGNYYYYTGNLEAGQTAPTFLNSVTFNEDISNSYTCQNGECNSTGTGYDDAEYTLTFYVETVQCSKAEEVWGINYDHMNDEATFNKGQTVIGRIKTMAAGSSKSYSDEDTLITGFVRAGSLPNNFTPATENTISTSNSSYPIYAWYDNGTIYFYSEAANIRFNENCSNMFRNLKALTNIDSLENIDASSITTTAFMFAGDAQLLSLTALRSWDVSNITSFSNIFDGCLGLTTLSPLSNWTINTTGDVNLYGMFIGCRNITSLYPLSGWDTSNVVGIARTFYQCSGLTNLVGLENWDVSNVTSMQGTFGYCGHLKTVEQIAGWTLNTQSDLDMGSMFFQCEALSSVQPLANWNTSRVTTIGALFQFCFSLESLSGLENWNTANVTNMVMTFSRSSITSLQPLANWNTSNVESMESMFLGTKISDLTPLSNWNVSSVTNMKNMFNECRRVTSLNGLSNWNVSSVNNMRSMFYYCISLTDASAINGWNITGVTFTANTDSGNGFFRMFQGCSVHPTFTNRAGTWSNGSFVPTT